MKISYNELSGKYFDDKLPSPDALAEALTFHAWEIEEVVKVGNDTVLDVKVLPDKSAWALSHRGIAKDISAILNIPLAHDLLATSIALEPTTPTITINRMSGSCDRYTSALIAGVKVGPSPQWLVDFLTSMGQRSINNVVDITNYVMFSIGQPLHAFDAGKLSQSNSYTITVRTAHPGESITTLTGETYILTPDDTLIVDGGTDTPIGIAGIKGGKVAEVDATTVDILLESAHFDAIQVRKSSQRLKLRTDASQRYENGVVSTLAHYGVVHGAEFISKFCGGTIVGYADSGTLPLAPTAVSVSLSKINSVLGLALTHEDVENILKRFGFVYEVVGDSFVVTPPFERPDLTIPEDIIEEIGRIHGYEHVPSIKIEPIPLREVNRHFYYAEKVRDELARLGFSEIFTSSFRDKDEVKLKNALASDKGYLRSAQGIVENMKEALSKNAPNADLFGVDQIRLFEFGKVFEGGGEYEVLVLGVRSKQGYTKKDLVTMNDASETLKKMIEIVPISSLRDAQTPIYWNDCMTYLIDFRVAVQALPLPTTYAVYSISDITYKPFSLFPYLTRDIAFWCDASTSEEEARGTILGSVGSLVQRVDMFDRFEKGGRVSYGFRIVFQSYEKTLDSAEADAFMQSVYDAVRAKGFEVR